LRCQIRSFASSFFAFTRNLSSSIDHEKFCFRRDSSSFKSLTNRGCGVCRKTPPQPEPTEVTLNTTKSEEPESSTVAVVEGNDHIPRPETEGVGEESVDPDGDNPSSSSSGDSPDLNTFEVVDGVSSLAIDEQG
jgi:hypothetical protein